jgi:hypothetical protein
MPTPYEKGNQNQTTTWSECIAFYEALAQRFPHVLRFEQIGTSDGGIPVHAGVVSADGVHDRAQIKAEGRTVFFNNNGIHPGEPEGVDACMAIVRDLCFDPARLAALGKTVLLFVPLYNVDGALNRANTSRVNQDGPEQFGFRGNSRHLDLNRDFVKCDTLNARIFNQLLTSWDPDVMVDTHTSNGADYPYTMTLIHTQADKLGYGLGPFLRETMLPHIYKEMEAKGWPTCPYVNPVKDTPDDGIAEFLEVPRFSTGFAALHHVIGFMPETHMLKPFKDRYDSMRALLDVTMAFTISHGEQIRSCAPPRASRPPTPPNGPWHGRWTKPIHRPSASKATKQSAASLLGDYQRLSYDRSKPWEKDIAYYNSFVPAATVRAPKGYIVPQAWREAIERLQWNGVEMARFDEASTVEAQYYHIVSVTSRPNAYEGHMYHDDVQLEARTGSFTVQPGDYFIPLKQANALRRRNAGTARPRLLLPLGLLQQRAGEKENFSDYVFEDLALEMLETEPELKAKFEAWKAANPALLSNQEAVLGFIFANGKRHAEPEWRRYPVLSSSKKFK